MHDCPECGQACDCDVEDTWFDEVEQCDHSCDEDDSDEYDDFEEL